MRTYKTFSLTRQINTIKRLHTPSVASLKNRFSSLPGVADSPDDEVYNHSGDDQEHDYFKILRTKRHFNVHHDELKSNYKRLMSSLHPDRHVAKSALERDRIHVEASKVTRAYDIITRPHSRALHLLELNGMAITENDTGELVGNEFLISVMNIREDIDDAISDDELNQILNKNNERVDNVCFELADAFESDSTERAKQLTAKLQYLMRIEETIRDRIKDVE